MAHSLVQVTDPVTGATSWVSADTGEVVSNAPRPKPVRAPVAEILFEREPAIHEKLLHGRALNWNEISRAADVILCAVSQDSLRVMFSGANMREIRVAIETMLKAKRLCDVLTPRLTGLPVSGKSASGAIGALLTLPGRR